MVRGTVALPSGTGKDVRIAVFAQGEAATEARAAGADFVGADDLAAEVEGGMLDFDVAIATPDLMPQVGKLGGCSARGPMPNPKTGTVTTDVAKADRATSRAARSSTAPTATATSTCRGQGELRPRRAGGQPPGGADELERAKPSSAKGRTSGASRWRRPWARALKIDPNRMHPDVTNPPRPDRAGPRPAISNAGAPLGSLIPASTGPPRVLQPRSLLATDIWCPSGPEGAEALAQTKVTALHFPGCPPCPWCSLLPFPGTGRDEHEWRCDGQPETREGRWVVDEVRGRLSDSQAALSLEYRGLNVADMSALRCLLRQAVPVIFHSHSWLPPGASRTLCGLALRRLRARIIASCRYVAEPWQPYAREIAVVYNGVAGPKVPLPPHNGPFTVGCIGRIAPEKGQREFIEAARIIHRRRPDARFAIYGATMFAPKSYEEEVRAAAADLPVEFYGWVENVYDALAQIDVLLVPSAPHEATTRVILEAAVARVPVIAFASGGIPEVLPEDCLASSVEELAQKALAHTSEPVPVRDFSLSRYRAEILRVLG